jgi:hypothetical protein
MNVSTKLGRKVQFWIYESPAGVCAWKKWGKPRNISVMIAGIGTFWIRSRSVNYRVAFISYSRPADISTCGHACSVCKQLQSHSAYSECCAINQTIRRRLLTTESWVQSQVTSCQMSGERSCKEVGFCPRFFGVSLLIIILPLVHTELSPPPDLCDSPGRQHIIKSSALKFWCFISDLTSKLNSVAVVRKRTMPTEGPPLVGEVGANFCG